MSTPSAPWADLDRARASLRLEDFPNYKLLSVVTLIQRNLTRAYLAPHRLGIPDWRVLALLGEVESMALRDLRQRTWMDKGQVSRVVSDLVARGLVSRRPDPRHNRRQIVAITALGRQTFEAIMPVARRMLCDLLSGLPLDERDHLFGALGSLEEAARSYRCGDGAE